MIRDFSDKEVITADMIMEIYSELIKESGPAKYILVNPESDLYKFIVEGEE